MADDMASKKRRKAPWDHEDEVVYRNPVTNKMESAQASPSIMDRVSEAFKDPAERAELEAARLRRQSLKKKPSSF